MRAVVVLLFSIPLLAQGGNPLLSPGPAPPKHLTLTTGAGLLGAASHAEGSAWSVVAAVTQWADRAMSRHYSPDEKLDSALRQGNTYLASSLGLDERANDLRESAQQWLYQTVGANG